MWGVLFLHISQYIHVKEQKVGVGPEILLESWFVWAAIMEENLDSN